MPRAEAEEPLERLQGEGFEEWWKRRWYADNLSPAAYGDAVRIARIRRGRYRRIPPQWRGQVTNPQTIRKRQSKRPHKSRRGSIYESGDLKLALNERRAPALSDWGLDELGQPA